jgi:hypothetical protein
MIRITPIAIKIQPRAGMMVSQRITPMIKAKMPRPTTVDSFRSLSGPTGERPFPGTAA